MLRSNRFIVNVLSFTLFFVSLMTVTSVFSATQLQESIEKKSLNFIKNQGQRDVNVAYYARALGGAVFITQKAELVYSLPKKTQQGFESWAFKETFITSNKLKPVQMGNANFVNALQLGQITKNINIKLESHDNNIEKLFYLSAGADVKNIQVKIQGVYGSEINQSGQLVLKTGLGPVVFTKPIAFQMKGDKKELVNVAYTLSNNQYGFTLGEYDPSRELIIDPLLASTFIGGENTTGAVTYDYDFIKTVSTIGDYVYVGGSTQSPNFPTALGYDSTYETLSEGFLMRFTGDLSTLVNATFIGNGVHDFEIDTDGSIVAVGQTNVGFPSTGTAYNYGGDVDRSGGFMARFSADLTTLISAGVIVNPYGLNEIELGNGAIYFGGITNNPDLPVTENAVGQDCNCPLEGAYGGLRKNVGFMGRISSDLSTIEVLSYLAVSPRSMTIVADSSLYLTLGSMRQYDADMTTLIAVGYGASDFAISDGQIIAVGGTTNNSLSTSADAFDSTCGTDGDCNNSGTEYYIPKADGFVAKYSMDLQTIIGGTYIGGSESDSILNVIVDDAGNIFIAGSTRSSDFPTTSTAFNRKYNAKNDIFVGRFSNDLTRLEYSSFIGGSHNDSVSGIALDASGALFIAGETEWYDDYPTTSGAFDTTFNGGANDGILSKFDTLVGSTTPDPEPTPDPDPTPEPTPDPSNNLPVADAGSDQTVSKRTAVTLDGSNSNDADGSIVSYSWKQTSGKGVKLKNSSKAVVTFTAPGVRKGRTKTLEFELTVTDDQGAIDRDRVIIKVKG